MGSKKSASAPPRGGAREPGRQLSAFYQDRANRLPEQTQRRVYGGAARAWRHGSGIVKNFHWEGEPQRELDIATTTSLRIFNHLNHGIYLRRPPFLPYGILLYGTYTPTRHGNRTNRTRLGKSVMSLSFPILPGSLDIPMRHSVFPYIFGWGCIQGT